MCRILVIEDDRIQQRLMSDVLSEEGHAVVVVGSLAAGLAELEQQIDLVVTDLHMQGGLLALEELVGASSAAVLVVSGHPDREAICAEAGVPSLGKPYDIDEVLRTVDALCPSPPFGSLQPVDMAS